jgi:hypothetical protein
MIDIEKAIEEGRDKVLFSGLICPVIKNYHAGHFTLLDPTSDHLMDVYIERIDGAIINGVWTVMEGRCLRFTDTPNLTQCPIKVGDEIPLFEAGREVGKITVAAVTETYIESNIKDFYRRSDGYRVAQWSLPKLDRDGSTKQIATEILDNAEFFKRGELLSEIDKSKLHSLPTTILQQIVDLIQTGLATSR